jgi:hypothetical protein
MTKIQKTTLKSKVLRYVNTLRKKVGLKSLHYLPRASSLPANISKTCPVAIAIKGIAFSYDGYVNCEISDFKPDPTIYSVTKWPKYVVKFINAFDEGEFSELNPRKIQ